MIDLLQLTRIDSHGSEATLLLQVDERSLTPRQDGLNSQGQPVSSPLRITVHSDRPVHKFTATSLTSAITRTRRLAQVTGQAIHHYQRLAPDILSSDAVLSSLRPTGTAVDPDAWIQDVPAVFWPLEETSMRWSTAHRVTLDGDLVFVVRRSDDHLVVVPGADPQRPHESWSELFAWAWDSSDYSAVGMAGYGTEGLYLVRPGLLAVVSMSDESYEVTFHRASPRARPLTLIERYAGLLQPETVLPHLALAAHGCSAEDLRSGDALSTCLGTADAHRLLEAISKKQADTQTPHP